MKECLMDDVANLYPPRACCRFCMASEHVERTNSLCQKVAAELLPGTCPRLDCSLDGTIIVTVSGWKSYSCFTQAGDRSTLNDGRFFRQLARLFVVIAIC